MNSGLVRSTRQRRITNTIFSSNEYCIYCFGLNVLEMALQRDVPCNCFLFHSPSLVFVSCCAASFPSLSSTVTLNILTISWNSAQQWWQSMSCSGTMTLLIINSVLFYLSIFLWQFISFFPCIDVVAFVSNAHKSI